MPAPAYPLGLFLKVKKIEVTAGGVYLRIHGSAGNTVRSTWDPPPNAPLMPTVVPLPNKPDILLGQVLGPQQNRNVSTIYGVFIPVQPGVIGFTGSPPSPIWGQMGIYSFRDGMSLASPVPDIFIQNGFVSISEADPSGSGGFVLVNEPNFVGDLWLSNQWQVPVIGDATPLTKDRRDYWVDKIATMPYAATSTGLSYCAAAQGDEKNSYNWSDTTSFDILIKVHDGATIPVSISNIMQFPTSCTVGVSVDFYYTASDFKSPITKPIKVPSDLNWGANLSLGANNGNGLVSGTYTFKTKRVNGVWQLTGSPPFHS